MNVLKFAFLFFCLFLLSISVAQQKTRILIITGGHDFDQQEFYELFHSFQDVEFTSVTHPVANNVYNTDKIFEYDALVFYDMNQEISEEQKTAFLDVLNKGIGCVFLHHSLASYQKWDEYIQIVGGQYLLRGRRVNPQPLALSFGRG